MSSVNLCDDKKINLVELWVAAAPLSVDRGIFCAR